MVRLSIPQTHRLCFSPESISMTTLLQTSSFSWPRRLAIVACLITSCVFTLRAMTPSAIATPTVATSAPKITAPVSASVGSPVQLVTKNIEDIPAGDLVLARDEHGSAIGLKPVKETYQRVSHHLRHLTFETPDGKQQTLSTTDEHPFWSVTADDFVEAGALIVGHSVTGPNGEPQTLVSSAHEEFPGGIPVFNFQVTDYHTYFVAATADKPVILVHNADELYADVGSLYGIQVKSEFSNSKLKRLTKDMKINGFDSSHPIEIAVVDGRKIILDGHHRARAAGSAGIRNVAVQVTEVSEARAAELLQQAAEAAQNLGLDHRWWVAP